MFGDGGSSFVENPVHTFPANGNYTIALTTTDTSGCSYISYQTINTQIIPQSIYGYALADTVPLDKGMIYLYSLDPVTNLLNPADSFLVDSSHYYNFYQVMPGTYYIKAVPAQNSMFSSYYFPTYYPNTTFWSSATAINLGTSVNPYDIELVPVPAPFAGPGNITGIITQGNKAFASGIPVSGVEVFLLNSSGEPIMMDYSDINGQFSFNNLLYGTYQVQGEMTGVPSFPVAVVLGPSSGTANISLIITPAGISAGIQHPDLGLLNNIRIYPNPAIDLVTIDVTSDNNRKLNFVVTDITGQVIIDRIADAFGGRQQFKLNISELSSGIYSLEVRTDSANSVRTKLSVVK